MRPPEDRLGTRPPPLDEAPFASTSRLWADIETAMQNLPFQHSQILFMTVCLGEGSWRNGTKRYNWREKVGDYWGMTGGEVNKSVDWSLKEICDSLNRFNYEREADTVVENDTPMIQAVADDAPVSLTSP